MASVLKRSGEQSVNPIGRRHAVDHKQSSGIYPRMCISPVVFRIPPGVVDISAATGRGAPQLA